MSKLKTAFDLITKKEDNEYSEVAEPPNMMK